jgi:hypothetical protein
MSSGGSETPKRGSAKQKREEEKMQGTKTITHCCGHRRDIEIDADSSAEDWENQIDADVQADFARSIACPACHVDEMYHQLQSAVDWHNGPTISTTRDMEQFRFIRTDFQPLGRCHVETRSPWLSIQQVYLDLNVAERFVDPAFASRLWILINDSFGGAGAKLGKSGR